MTHARPLAAPFPWFGGKSRCAALVWSRLGEVRNYVEPFAGSLAILLHAPLGKRTETVNDLDGFVANFWRAVSADPDAVAQAADWPVNEADLEARHIWLVTEGRKKLKIVLAHPDGYDAKIAAWWVWGICAWIGDRWCSGTGPWSVDHDGWRNRRSAGQGINRSLPHLGNAGRGINRKLPHLGDAGQEIRAYFGQLQDRLRRVRVACGDWRRVVTRSVTHFHGLTAVVLDPPYGEGKMDYAAGGNASRSVADEVRKWAAENGSNPLLRIALCCHEGQFEMPSDWTAESWRRIRGYAARDRAAGDRRREQVWFSPHCLSVPDSISLPGISPSAPPIRQARGKLLHSALDEDFK